MKRAFTAVIEIRNGDPESQKRDSPLPLRLESPAARARNLARALHVLSGAAGRFMARTWANGS